MSAGRPKSKDPSLVKSLTRSVRMTASDLERIEREFGSLQKWFDQMKDMIKINTVGTEGIIMISDDTPIETCKESEPM